MNGDGYHDILVGTPDFTNGEAGEGKAFLYLGSAAGTGATPAWTFESNQSGAAFASAVAGTGDVNGDGFDDVAIGAYRFDAGQPDEGKVFVFHGSSTGLATSVTWSFESDQTAALLGQSVGSAGDVNGDGYADLIAGAWQFDAGETDEGRCLVFLGSPAGLDSTPAWTAESDQATAGFGVSVATAGDVNGNGRSDVIVGANFFSADEFVEGKVFVYHGGCDGLAGSVAYGAGKTGTNGIPTLSSAAPPAIGGAAGLTISNGLAGAGPAFVFAGVAPATVPFDGGTLLVAPLLTVLLPPLDGSGNLALTVAIPASAAFCGLTVHLQAGFVDPGAAGPYHTALTNGLAWTFGG